MGCGHARGSAAHAERGQPPRRSRAVRGRRRDGWPSRRRGGQRDGRDVPRRARCRPTVAALATTSSRRSTKPTSRSTTPRSHNAEQAGMGTTITAIAVVDDPLDGEVLAVANVGDLARLRAPPRSPAPGDDRSQLRPGARRRGSDHARRGAPRTRAATSSPAALGIEPYVRVDTWTMPIIRGDRFLLCSDGLVDEVTDEVIQDLSLEHRRRPDGGGAGAGRRRQLCPVGATTSRRSWSTCSRATIRPIRPRSSTSSRCGTTATGATPRRDRDRRRPARRRARRAEPEWRPR